MNKWLKHIGLLVICGGLMWSGCATMNPQKGVSHYREEIIKFKARLETNPDDVEALRELGVICFELQRYQPARKYLIEACKRELKDPRTLFYLGMTFESETQNQVALKIYQTYTDLDRQSPYYPLLEGQYHRLTRKLVREEMRSLLEQEPQLDTAEVSPRTVAVFPLVYQGKAQEFAALGKGLSEIMSIDLSQVPELTVIDQIHLLALMEELSPGQTLVLDENTIPRLGKLLSAGKIVSGSYNVEDENIVQLNVAFWDVRNRPSPDYNDQKNFLENLFELEKTLVFSLIDEMSLALTSEQLEKIQRIPTKSVQAFMIYCLGLEKEQAGQFKAAAKFYQKAVKLDPNFELAGQKAETNQALSLVTGDKDNLLLTMKKWGKPVSPLLTDEGLISHRLKNLCTSIDCNFVPGQDSRES
ncbi:MAG: hypothetical protein ONB05_12240, partial [candidate division KSB1 bacterium]|nr:hypothetical protein [candidate division KSB1 bacterium]